MYGSSIIRIKQKHILRALRYTLSVFPWTLHLFCVINDKFMGIMTHSVFPWTLHLSYMSNTNIQLHLFCMTNSWE